MTASQLLGLTAVGSIFYIQNTRFDEGRNISKFIKILKEFVVELGQREDKCLTGSSLTLLNDTLCPGSYLVHLTGLISQNLYLSIITN